MMESISEPVTRAVEQLLGRASGPLHMRLVLQPVVAMILAIRAGLKDSREGQPLFFWEFLTNVAARKRLLRSAWKDIGKVFILAVVLDVAYQLIALRAFHLVQTLIVAVVFAIVPYVLLRGPTTRLTRGRHKASTGPGTK